MATKLVFCAWYGRRDLATFACHQQMQDCYSRQDTYRAEMKNFACKHHYLVSTKAQPGVYNSPFRVSAKFCQLYANYFRQWPVIIKHSAQQLLVLGVAKVCISDFMLRSHLHVTFRSYTLACDSHCPIVVIKIEGLLLSQVYLALAQNNIIHNTVYV